jgi:hypothetical protein
MGTRKKLGATTLFIELSQPIKNHPRALKSSLLYTSYQHLMNTSCLLNFFILWYTYNSLYSIWLLQINFIYPNI